MTSTIQNVAFGCSDTYALGQWWSQVLGYPLHPDDQPGDPEAIIELPGFVLFFNEVPEPKTVKNRVHLCLRPDDVPRDQEVERLLGIGATMVEDRRRPDGRGWAVLADPEGNEFCVLRGRLDAPLDGATDAAAADA